MCPRHIEVEPKKNKMLIFMKTRINCCLRWVYHAWEFKLYQYCRTVQEIKRFRMLMMGLIRKLHFGIKSEMLKIWKMFVCLVSPEELTVQEDSSKGYSGRPYSVKSVYETRLPDSIEIF